MREKRADDFSIFTPKQKMIERTIGDARASIAGKRCAAPDEKDACPLPAGRHTLGTSVASYTSAV